MKLHKHSLTLLELVICLGIVAALASLLLDNFAALKLQECADQTREKGWAVQQAIQGAGASAVSRFLSDMGRWPRVHVDSDEQGFRLHGRNLAQLYDRTIFYHHDKANSMLNHPDELTIDAKLLDLSVEPIFANYAFPQAVLNVGWRGPYLNFSAPEGAQYLDGWGNSWKILHQIYLNKPNNSNKLQEKATLVNETETAPNSNIEIEGIKSFGADQREDVSGKNPDYAERDQQYTFAPDLNFATLHVTLRVRDDADPARWLPLQLKNTPPPEAHPWLSGGSQTAEKNEVVYIINGSQKYYYCSRIPGNAQEPHTVGNFLMPGPGWECRVRYSWVTPDAVKVVLFAPAKTINTATSGTNSTMKTGFYRFSPATPDELANPASNLEKVLPFLQYRSGDNFFNDTEATLNSQIDTDVQWGVEPNKNRLRARHNWRITNTTLDSTFKIDNLVPGRRKILAFAGFLDGNLYFNRQISELEDIVLHPGNNYVTIYLEPRD